MSLIIAGCSAPKDEFEINLTQAKQFLDHGEVKQAIKILEELKINHPNHPEIVENLAFAFTVTEEFHTAAFYFAQLAEKFPDKIEYFKLSAQSWEKAGDVTSAIALYEAYILRNPGDWLTWRNVADLYLASRQTSKAIRAYATSSDLKFDPQLGLKAALLANSTGNYREAEEEFFSLLLVADPDVAQRAHLGLLEIKHKRQQWEAVEGLIQLLDVNFPGAIEAEGLSRIRRDLNAWKQARLMEKKRQEEEEKRRKLLEEQQRERALQLAAIREEAQRKAEAEAEAKAEAEADSILDSEQDPTQGSVAETTEASDQVSSTEDSAHESAPAPTQEASLESAQDDGQDAEARPETPSQEEQAFANARLEVTSNPSQAVTMLWEVINRGMDTADVFAVLSQAYFNLGEYNASEMTSLEALRRQPDNNQLLFGYLNVLQRNKSIAETIREMRKFYNQFPQNADLLLLLARTCAKPGGDPFAARNYYQQFILLAPNHPEIDNARREAGEL